MTRHSFLASMTAASLMLACGKSVPAQMSAAEHASHHAAPGASSMASPATQPAQAAPAGAPTVAGSGQMQSAAPAAPGGMGGGMDDMMKGMGTPPTKEIYPTLMALPDGLTPEDRDKITRLAAERKQEGTASLSSGLERLSEATANQDYVAMQQATEQMRSGLDDFQSGIAGQRVIAEGTLPRNVALDWFRREMNLASPSAPEARTYFGVSLFHLFTMLLLVGFAVAMVAMYFFKMRRAVALFGRLAPDAKPPPSGGSPPHEGGSDPPTSKPPLPPATPPVAEPSQPHEESAVPMSQGATSPPAQRASSSESTSTAPATANWRGMLRVGSIVTETPNVKTFRLLPAGNDRYLPFTFLPGQFLNVAFSIGGARMNRSYSISSSPNEREYVDLTIRREPRGAVSRHIDDLVRVGELIETGGPVGKFIFTGTESDSIVLLSGGVGITPMMCISRYLTERSWPGEIFFVYTCRTPADYIFADKIPALQQLNPKLHVAVTVSRAQGTDWRGARGRITKEWLLEAVPGLASRTTHLCGPPEMMDAVRAIYAELNIPAGQLKTEAFGAVKPALPPPGTVVTPLGPATGPNVTFSKSNKSAKVRLDLRIGDTPPKQSILELSEELGIGIEFSCRVGTCGICKVKMSSGNVDMEVQDALDENDKSNGIILACQAKPTNDVTVEA